MGIEGYTNLSVVHVINYSKFYTVSAGPVKILYSGKVWRRESLANSLL